MKKIKLINSIFILVSVLAVINCSPKESTRNKIFMESNYSEDEIIEVNQKNQGEVIRLEKLLNAVEPIVMSQSVLSQKDVDATLLMSKVITPLRDITLNLNYLLNEDFRYLRTKGNILLIPRLVSLFNHSIVMIYNKQKSLITSNNLLRKYKEIILWDCDQDLKGSCDFIKFYKFADGVYTTQILKMIHNIEKDENEKMRIVRAGFDIKNRSLDISLRFMMLERLSKSFELSEKKKLSQSRLKADADLFALLLELNGEELESSEMYKKMIAEINPWSLSRTVDDPKTPAMTNLLALGAKNFIYENGKVSSSLTEAIDRVRYVVGPRFEQGIDFQKENIQGLWKNRFENEAPKPEVAKKYKKIKENVIANSDVEIYNNASEQILKKMLKGVNYTHDEYYFLVHQIYFGHYNNSDADSFWKHSLKNKKRLIEASLNLIKMQMVNNIVYTNTRMTNFYNKNAQKSLIDMLIESEAEASTISLSWQKIMTRSNNVNTFINRVVSSSDKLYGELKSQTEDYINSIPVNIKYLVSYPNMFPLIHIMASREMVQTFWFGEINYNTIINLFFSGAFPPWFKFNGDSNKLDTIGIIYAFYYTLLTQTFETYKSAGNKVIKFSTQDFFKVVVKKMIDSNEKELEETIDKFETDRNNYKANINSMQETCKEEKTLQKIERERIDGLIKAGNFQYKEDFQSQLEKRVSGKSSITFENLGADIYPYTLGSPLSDSYGKYFDDVYGRGVEIVFNSFNSSIRSKQITSQILIDLYKLFDSSDNDLDTIVSDQFNKIEKLKANFMNQYYLMYDEMSDCEKHFLIREKDIKNAIIFEEAKSLGALYDDISRILKPLTKTQRSNLSAENKAALDDVISTHFAFNKNPKMSSEYNKGYGFVELDGQRLIVYKSDYFVKVAHYLTTLFGNQYQINYPSNFNALKNGLMEKTQFHEIKFNISSDISAKVMEKERAAFINSGLKGFRDNIAWAGTAPSIVGAINKLNTLVSLYKLQKTPLKSGVDCNNNEDLCREVKAEEIISYHKWLINFSNITIQDREVLELLEKDSKYIEGIHKDLIKKDFHGIYAYYDLLFKRVVSDGSVSASISSTFLGKLRALAKSISDIKLIPFIFPFSGDVEKILLKHYKAWLDEYFAISIKFLEEVKKQSIENKKSPHIFEYVYEMGRSHSIGKEGGSLNVDPFISPLLYGKFTSHIDVINDQTDYYFRKDIKAYKNKIKNIVEDKPGDNQ